MFRKIATQAEALAGTDNLTLMSPLRTQQAIDQAVALLGTPNLQFTGGVTGSGYGTIALTVQTNANLTGPITSIGNATSITNNAVGLGKLAQVTGPGFLGSSANSPGNVQFLLTGDSFEYLSGTFHPKVLLTRGLAAEANSVGIGTGVLAATTSGINNFAIGTGALALLTTGSENIVIGNGAGAALTIGGTNLAIGQGALAALATDSINIAIGNSALAQATAGQNIAIGYLALGNSVVTGTGNIGIGLMTLGSLTGGNSNIVVGTSMQNLVGGSNNIAVGYQALYYATQQNWNIAIGQNALFTHGNLGVLGGDKNVAIGYNALEFMNGYSNCVGLGSNTAVTSSNQVQLGDNTTTTYVYGTVQNRSDSRDKTAVRDTKLGLEFILALRPRDYKWDYREDYAVREGNEVSYPNKDGSKARKRYHHGFIAQEVEQAMISHGFEFGGFQDHKVSGGQDVLSLGYDEFIAPLVAAIQELHERIQKLEAK